MRELVGVEGDVVDRLVGRAVALEDPPAAARDLATGWVRGRVLVELDR